jgi:nitrite reductase (NO-forming)
MIPYHLSHRMYGLMVVEPPGGWPKVDKDFYVMEGDIYLKGDRTQGGVHEAAVDKMVNEIPDFVVFNGSVGSLSKERALKAKVGETVRIFFVSFLGMPDPTLYRAFTSSARFLTKSIRKVPSKPSAMCNPPGPGRSDDGQDAGSGDLYSRRHSLGPLQKGAAGFLDVQGPPNPKVFQSIQQGSQDGGGH